MIGFFQEDKDSYSMSRLCMFGGLIGTIIGAWLVIICWMFAKTETNIWLAIICAIPGGIGCLPYTLKELKKIVVKSPKIIESIARMLKK